jgi:hypothetical protein
VGDHTFERVDVDEGGYVLRCDCGWRSTPHVSAEAVGEEWDQHRMETAEQAC